MTLAASYVEEEQRIPKSLFDYEILARLGEGARSVIFAAAENQSHQLYALKYVKLETEKDQRFFEQLQSEMAVGQKIRHPGLRRSIKLLSDGSGLRKVTSAVLVLELFDGLPLDQFVPPSLPKVVKCFVQVARALQALHVAGYVHCDLKPNNILLNDKGVVKVIDLGQSCPIGTRKLRMQGTPDYIAPEQVKCDPVSPRTDVFNFGATLYWVLTGRKMPTALTSGGKARRAIPESDIVCPRVHNPMVPESLSNLVMECVRPDPDRRPADAEALARRLELVRFSLDHHARSA